MCRWVVGGALIPEQRDEGAQEHHESRWDHHGSTARCSTGESSCIHCEISYFWESDSSPASTSSDHCHFVHKRSSSDTILNCCLQQSCCHHTSLNIHDEGNGGCAASCG